MTPLAALFALPALALTAAALLWLAAHWLALAAAMAGRARVRHAAAGGLMMAAALWWPLQLAVPGAPLAMALAAAACAALAALALVAWRTGQARPAAALAVAALLAAWGMLESAQLASIGALLPLPAAVPLVGLLLATLAGAAAGRSARWETGTAALLFGVALAAVAASVAPAGGLNVAAGVWLLPLALAVPATLGLEAVTAARGRLPQARGARHLDALTGLQLAQRFDDHLAETLEAGDDAVLVAVLHANMNGFKALNDSHGHRAGDRVLESVARRLRRIAAGDDALGRTNGSGFLLRAEVADEAAARALAEKVQAALAEPHSIDGETLLVPAAVGVALWPGVERAARLLPSAEAAMHAAQGRGDGRPVFYSPALDAHQQNAEALLQDLRRAIATGSLELHYQPKIISRTAKVSAVEALLRWRHPTRGMVPPGEFVPLAEAAGLIGLLGDWVVEEACRQMAEWRNAGLRMRVAINVSAHQMKQPDLAERIGAALTRHRVHPGQITVEVTETAAMEDTRTTQETFRQLAALGVQVSIDDFGTGYSSLAYLRQLPATELKIDRAFVTDLEHSADARAIVDAVVRLAHALGLKVVAEGVENSHQRRVLVELGCDELQGFLFARPMAARTLLRWAMDDRPKAQHFSGSVFTGSSDEAAVAEVKEKRRRKAGAAVEEH